MSEQFKEYAVRGNVVDIAVGIMIGAGFGKIITSFVEDLFLPLLSLITGGLNLRDKLITLQPATETAKAVTVNYGIFLMTLIDFLVIAFAVFLLVRAMINLKKQRGGAAATTKDCPECMMPIPLQARRCGHCTSAIQ